MSIEPLNINRATSEIIDAPLTTPTRGRKLKVVSTDEAGNTDQGGRFVLLVLPFIVTREEVIHEYTNV